MSDQPVANSKSLYLHRTAQHRKTRTNIHVSSAIRTKGLSIQAMKAYATDSVATGNDSLSVPVMITTEPIDRFS
jgi:hypothetical protein